MCQPGHFLSKFLIFRTFPAYPYYKLHSYKKKSVVLKEEGICNGTNINYVVMAIMFDKVLNGTTP